MKTIVRMLKHSTSSMSVRAFIKFSQIEAGIKQALTACDSDPEIVAQYPDWATAKKALAKFETSVFVERGNINEWLRAIQYEVEELGIDEDGDIDYGDVRNSAWSAVPDEIIIDDAVYRRVFGNWRGEFIGGDEDD